jgi:hypothetical protein
MPRARPVSPPPEAPSGFLPGSRVHHAFLGWNGTITHDPPPSVHHVMVQVDGSNVVAAAVVELTPCDGEPA